jgi:serine/threonine protein kinase
LILLYTQAIKVINIHNIYHHDIKSGNILLGKDNKCRLIDWGISNIMIYKPYFIFNQPYSYLLLNDSVQNSIKTLQKTKINCQNFILQYIKYTKVAETEDYKFTNQILNMIQNSNHNVIHSLLIEYYVEILIQNKSITEMRDIYIHNLDIVGLITVYMDFIYKINKQGSEDIFLQKLYSSLIQLYQKYMLQSFQKINSEEFINDLTQLNEIK